MDKMQIEGLSSDLYNALKACRPIPPIKTKHPEITIDDAYNISLGILAKRLSAGEKIIGKKIGVTSEAVQKMLNVHQPDFGFLTDRMLFSDTVPVSGSMIMPKAEGEIAFVLKKSLNGPGVSEADVLAATEAVMPCFEVVDSRIANWEIGIEDTIADNASCGAFVINDRAAKNPLKVDLVGCEMIVNKNGRFLSKGKGAAALGNPLTCVAWLANALGRYGVTLEAGDIILSGSLVPLEPVVAGDELSLSISSIGDLSVEFV